MSASSMDMSNKDRRQNTYSLLSVANMVLAWTEDIEATGIGRHPGMCS